MGGSGGESQQVSMRIANNKVWRRKSNPFPIEPPSAQPMSRTVVSLLSFLLRAGPCSRLRSQVSDCLPTSLAPRLPIRWESSSAEAVRPLRAFSPALVPASR